MSCCRHAQPLSPRTPPPLPPTLHAACHSPHPAVPSLLWGCEGETFEPAARFIDWSFAGFAAAGFSLGDAQWLGAVSADIKADYGAKGVCAAVFLRCTALGAKDTGHPELP